MKRKSQVDKFNARVAKKQVDEQAVNTREYQKKQENINKYGAEGVEELMSQGNIKEAAVVFSHEGMKAFANMFGNSMESAVVRVLDNQIGKITQTMEERMGAIVEAKMMEMLEGMTEGMKQFQAQQTTSVLQSTKTPSPEFLAQIQDVFLGVQDIGLPSKDVKGTSITQMMEEPQFPISLQYVPPEDSREAVKEKKPVETPMIDWDKAFEIDKEEKKAKTKKEKTRPAIADAPRPKKADYFSNVNFDNIEGLQKPDRPTGYRYGSSAPDVAVVAPFVLSLFKKYAGKEIMSSVILKVLNENYGIKFVNPTLAFRKIMTLDPNLENVGFGVYKYEEKNFKPTV